MDWQTGARHAAWLGALSPDDISRSYHRKALAHHPDRIGDVSPQMRQFHKGQFQRAGQSRDYLRGLDEVPPAFRYLEAFPGMRRQQQAALIRRREAAERLQSQRRQRQRRASAKKRPRSPARAGGGKRQSAYPEMYRPTSKFDPAQSQRQRSQRQRSQRQRSPRRASAYPEMYRPASRFNATQGHQRRGGSAYPAPHQSARRCDPRGDDWEDSDDSDYSC